MDPITIIATANAAYSLLKKGIQAGKDLEDMGSTLAKWAGAISDIDFLEQKAKNPPIWKVGGSIQAEAIEIFAMKKKIESQRAELKQYICFSYGLKAWDELLHIEGQVRKQRQATEYRKQELKETIITVFLSVLLIVAGIGSLIVAAFFLVEQQKY